MEGYLGMIMLWPMNWAPRGWAICDGSLLDIGDYNALYALLGTNYGGDGRVTFGLPDLRGRIPVGYGQGPGQPYYELGWRGGVAGQTIQMNESHLPQHSHELQNTQVVIPEHSVEVKLEATENAGQHSQPVAGDKLGAPQTSGRDVELYTSASDKSVELSSQSVKIPASTVAVAGQIENTGGGEALHFDNRQPYLTLNYIICIRGDFPSRN